MGKDRIYNADQAVLFYNQSPSCNFVKIENSKEARGVKKIISK